MVDPKEVERSARRVMDSFMEALKQVDQKKDNEFFVRREHNIREAVTQPSADPDFSGRMLKNAPKIKDGCVLAEKKKW